MTNLQQFHCLHERTHVLPVEKRHPTDTSSLLAQANRIVEGYHPFNGTDEVFVGLQNIDWLGGHVNHQEWRSQLNRFFVLDTLSAAYESTGDGRYSIRARRLIEDWLDFMDARPGVKLHPADNRLNLSIRIGNSCQTGWLQAVHRLADTTGWDAAFTERIFASIAHQLDVLLDIGFTAMGNWRISELDTMLLTALRCPFLPHAERYMDSAKPLLKNALRTQFLPDGSHLELTPNYHFWMSDVLLSYYLLQRKFPELAMGLSLDSVEKAIRLNAYYERFPINDSHPFYDRDVCPNQQFQKANQALSTIARPPLPRPLPDLLCRDAGYVFAFDADNELFFDMSAYAGSHTHSSRLQVALNSGGRPLVVDPGVFSYEMSDPMAAAGKGTPSHSTITIDTLNQGPAAASLALYDSTPRYMFAEGCFDGGYWSGKNLWGFKDGVGVGRWARHTRAVFFVRGEYILVLDAVNADPGLTIHNHWQLAPVANFKADAEAFSFATSTPDGPNLLLKLVHVPEGKVAMTCRCGETSPHILGWAGVPGQRQVPAPMVCFDYPGGVPRGGLSALLLAPYSGAAPDYGVNAPAAQNTGSAIYMEVRTPHGTTDRIAWRPGARLPLDTGLPLATDGSFAYMRQNGSGKPVAGYSPNGQTPACR